MGSGKDCDGPYSRGEQSPVIEAHPWRDPHRQARPLLCEGEGMDAAWISVTSALAGVAVGGALSLAGDTLASKRQDRRDAAQREHDRSERRYDARREAYLAFGTACHRALGAAVEYEYERGGVPGDHGHEGPDHAVLEALDLVRMIGPEEVERLAQAASDAVHTWVYAQGRLTYGQANTAVEEYAAEARRVLRLDKP